MTAIPLRSTGDEPALAESASGAPAASTGDAPAPRVPLDSAARLAAGPARAPRQLTVRALLVGAGIGTLLAAGNVYTGLKCSFIDGGAVTAALLSFTFFAMFRRWSRNTFSPLENNVAQTTAASAGIMTLVHGLMGPIPALMLMGRPLPPPWALWSWGVGLALLGVVVGVVARRKLIVDDGLPFPTGTATAELIEAVHADRRSAARRTKLLVFTALAAGLLCWFRDGRPALVPQAFYLPFAVGGLSAATLTLGVATSPLMAATGVFMGLRAAASLFAGGVLAWGIIAPVGLNAGWIVDHNYSTIVGWLVWPALGMMLASTIVPVVLNWRAIARVLARTIVDARGLMVRTTDAAAIELARKNAPARAAGATIVVLAFATLAFTGWRAFGVNPFLTAASLLLSVVLSNVCARAAGETDIAPVGQFGTIAQFLFAGTGPVGSILAGAAASGNASETAQTMWAFKAGHTLRASIRAQVVAQLLGALVGSLVVVPVYLLVVRAYPLGSERLPAATALSWKVTAEALTRGIAGVPTHGVPAVIIAFIVGTVLCVLGRTRASKFLPSPMALGIATITPVSLSAAALLGVGAMLLARRRLPALAEGESGAVAAGALAGESILGVVIALLTALGAL